MSTITINYATDDEFSPDAIGLLPTLMEQCLNLGGAQADFTGRDEDGHVVYRLTVTFLDDVDTIVIVEHTADGCVIGYIPGDSE